MSFVLTEDQQGALTRLGNRDPGARVTGLVPIDDQTCYVITRRSDGGQYIIKPNGFTRRRLPDGVAASDKELALA